MGKLKFPRMLTSKLSTTAPTRHSGSKPDACRKGWFNPAPDDQGYKPVLPVETKEKP